MSDIEAIGTAALEHLPFYITPPGQTDVLLVAMGIFLLLAVVGVGVLYFTIHALPEHLAHGGNKIQLQIVSVLAILALFTHNHIFWIIGLLLALIQFPDFQTPVTSMASSLEKIADRTRKGNPAMESLNQVDAIKETSVTNDPAAIAQAVKPAAEVVVIDGHGTPNAKKSGKV